MSEKLRVKSYASQNGGLYVSQQQEIFRYGYFFQNNSAKALKLSRFHHLFYCELF